MPWPAATADRSWARRAGLGLTALSLVAMTSPVVAGASPAPATKLYAYARGAAAAPTGCPTTTTASDQCTLAEALSLAGAGTTVMLATPGRSGRYVGNWVVSTRGTTSSAPVTIEPAPGVSGPILDGNKGEVTGCGTPACDGPVLTIGTGVHFDLNGVTVQNADNTGQGLGGAIENVRGGTVVVSGSDFLRNYTNADGGAIDNADLVGRGTLTVTGSTFMGNYAVNDDGGAIANADVGGRGSVSVSGSTFSGNNAINGDGGAIDSGDTMGTGHLVVSSSTFVDNLAGRAGAIDNADNAKGTLVVTRSSFSGNVAVLDDAGAIDNADWGGTGALTVSGSTFSGNDTVGNGGGIDNADSMAQSHGTAVISNSTFSKNIADVHGGAIANADFHSHGTVVISASTFSANKANDIYGSAGGRGGGAISTGNAGVVWAAADIFDGFCHRVGGSWDDEGYNVGQDGTCLGKGTSDVSHGAGRLGPLADNGGPTKTMLPLKGNPALGVIPYKTTVVLDHMTITLCPVAGSQSKGPGQHCNAGAAQ